MVTIVARLRRDIGDVAASPVFDGADLESFLDARSHDVAGYALAPDATLTGDPTVFRAPWRWWEDSVVVSDGSGGVLDPDGAITNPMVGVWSFLTSPGVVVYVDGRYFDYWGAAADALEVWAARVAIQFDFQTDGQQFERSQKSAGLLKVAREYGRRAFVHS